MSLTVLTTSQDNTPGRITCLLEARKEIVEALLRSQERQAEQYNRKRDPTLDSKVGDRVFLATDNLVTNEGSKKLSDLRTRPFLVLKQVNNTIFKLKLPSHMKVNLNFNVKLLTLTKPDPIQQQSHT